MAAKNVLLVSAKAFVKKMTKFLSHYIKHHFPVTATSG